MDCPLPMSQCCATPIHPNAHKKVTPWWLFHVLGLHHSMHSSRTHTLPSLQLLAPFCFQQFTPRLAAEA